MNPHLASVVFIGSIVLSPTTPTHQYILGQSPSSAEARSGIIVAACSDPSLDEVIDQVCSDPASVGEDEVAPNTKAINDLKALIHLAESEIQIPTGDVSPYFGELSVTWYHGFNMLRVTSFSEDKPPRLDYGTTPEGALGEYHAIENATRENLADRIRWLFSDDVSPDATNG